MDLSFQEINHLLGGYCAVQHHVKVPYASLRLWSFSHLHNINDFRQTPVASLSQPDYLQTDSCVIHHRHHQDVYACSILRPSHEIAVFNGR